jgi:hypothetical protein
MIVYQQHFHIHAAKPATETTAKTFYQQLLQPLGRLANVPKSNLYVVSNLNDLSNSKFSQAYIQYKNKILNKKSGTFGLY